MGVKERNFTLLLLIWKKHLIRVPREVTIWALGKAGVEEWLVKTVMAMYEGAQTVVRTTEVDSKTLRISIKYK